MRPTTGYIDLQVNGFLGVDFSDPALTADDFARVPGAAGARHGGVSADDGHEFP